MNYGNRKVMNNQMEDVAITVETKQIEEINNIFRANIQSEYIINHKRYFTLL